MMLCSEQELLREEMETVKSGKEKLKARVTELEEMSKRFRDVDRSQSTNEDDVSTPLFHNSLGLYNLWIR